MCATAKTVGTLYKTGAITNGIPDRFEWELRHMKAEISGFQSAQFPLKTVRYTVSYGPGFGHRVTASRQQQQKLLDRCTKPVP